MPDSDHLMVLHGSSRGVGEDREARNIGIGVTWHIGAALLREDAAHFSAGRDCEANLPA
jgi:hypothetical protein